MLLTLKRLKGAYLIVAYQLKCGKEVLKEEKNIKEEFYRISLLKYNIIIFN
jgi:hypothetical protein